MLCWLNGEDLSIFTKNIQYLARVETGHPHICVVAKHSVGAVLELALSPVGFF